jgi:hypothetical protein
MKMAKSGYSGGKAGAKSAGKGSTYKGKTYGGLGIGKSYGKGYKMGIDGSALLPGYIGGKKALANYLQQALGNSLQEAYGIGILSESMRTGQPFSNNINPGYEASPFDNKIDEMSRYRNIDESDENEKPCSLCGAPAIRGGAFCARCTAGLN